MMTRRLLGAAIASLALVATHVSPAAASNPGAASVDPADVARDLLAEAPLPNVQIRMNPALGLVAVPAWFWIEGYDGGPITVSRTIEVLPGPPVTGGGGDDSDPFEGLPPECRLPENWLAYGFGKGEVPRFVMGGMQPLDPSAADPSSDGGGQPSTVSVTVEVVLHGTRYAWSFGDGAGLVTTSLGQPYPLQSDIQHVYERSSLGQAPGYPVRVTVEFAAEYRVNGGPPQALPARSQVFETAYRVQEVQSILGAR